MVTTNAASIALNASRDTLCSIHAITTSRVTHRNGAIKHIFTRIRSTEDHQQIVLYSFVFPCACSSSGSSNIASVFLCEDLSYIGLVTSVGCISLQNASRTALCYAANTIK